MPVVRRREEDKMKSGILLIVFSWCVFHSSAQTVESIRFVPLYNGVPVALNTTYSDASGKQTAFSALRFYISHVTLYASGMAFPDPQVVHLVDLEDTASLSIRFWPATIDSIGFSIGIDSLTSVSGIYEGDLDPTKGMYWAWNSGYVNFKLQGTSSASSNPDRSFELHLGGYLPPYPTIRRVVLPIGSANKEARIAFDLNDLLQTMDLTAVPAIMIPGRQAAQLSTTLSTLFHMVP